MIQFLEKKHNTESEHTEFFAVGSGNATAIDDTGVLRHCGRHSRGKILSRVSVYFLSLCSCSDLSGSDCPNGLVRNDDAAVFRREFELASRGRRGVWVTNFQSSGESRPTTAWSCSSTTCCVRPASLSASVSPTQSIIRSPASSAARVFSATIADVSPKRVRRSE